MSPSKIQNCSSNTCFAKTILFHCTNLGSDENELLIAEQNSDFPKHKHMDRVRFASKKKEIKKIISFAWVQTNT